jgi:hypothetical protein
MWHFAELKIKNVKLRIRKPNFFRQLQTQHQEKILPVSFIIIICKGAKEQHRKLFAL